MVVYGDRLFADRKGPYTYEIDLHTGRAMSNAKLDDEILREVWIRDPIAEFFAD